MTQREIDSWWQSLPNTRIPAANAEASPSSAITPMAASWAAKPHRLRGGGLDGLRWIGGV